MNARQGGLVLALILGAALQGNAKDVAHDGNWWRTQFTSSKYQAVSGVLDRICVGPNLSALGMTVNVSLKPGSANPDNSGGQPYVRISGAQIVDALDDLYSDNRNSGISLSNAVTIVVHGVAGAPQKALRKLIEEYRKPGC